MKGFGAGERNGLIVFCCIVLIFLMMGPVAEKIGCAGETRFESATPSAYVAKDSIGNDSIDAERNETIEEADKVDNTSGRKKGKRIKRGRKGERGANPKSDPQRRSYLDEPV